MTGWRSPSNTPRPPEPQGGPDHRELKGTPEPDGASGQSRWAEGSWGGSRRGGGRGQMGVCNSINISIHLYIICLIVSHLFEI